jgi:hypothetical protein
MSIDGIINEVGVDQEGNIILHLVDPPEPGRLAGQPTLTIEPPHTYMPQPGLHIWGGNSTCELVTPNGRRQYRRLGYTRLREDS